MKLRRAGIQRRGALRAGRRQSSRASRRSRGASPQDQASGRAGRLRATRVPLLVVAARFAAALAVFFTLAAPGARRRRFAGGSAGEPSAASTGVETTDRAKIATNGPSQLRT